MNLTRTVIFTTTLILSGSPVLAQIPNPSTGDAIMATPENTIKYDEDLSCNKAQTDNLPPELLAFYETTLPLFEQVDRNFPPADILTAKGPHRPPPPKCLIPSMIYNDESVDGRSVDDSYITFEDNQWHYIVFEDRSVKVVKHLKFDQLEDLVYDQLEGYTITRGKALAKEFLRDTNQLDTDAGRSTFNTGLLRTETGKMALRMMQSVKPEWVEKLRDYSIAWLQRYISHTPEQVKQLEDFDPVKNQ